MKRVYILSLSMLLSATLVAAQPRVALFSMEFATVKTEADAAFGTSVDVGKGMADLMVDALVQSGAVDVYERERLEKIVAEQDATNSSRFDPTTAAKIGRNAGVQAVVIGSITKFVQHEGKIAFVKVTEAEIELTARVIDTSTGKILFTVKGAANAKGKGFSVSEGLKLVPGNSMSGKMGAVIPAAGAAIPMTEWVGQQFKGTLIGTVMSKAAEQAATEIVRQRDRIAGDAVAVIASESVEATPPQPKTATVAPLTEQVLVEMLKNQVPEAQVIEIVNTHQNFAIAPLEPSWAIVVAANKVPLAVQNAVRGRASLSPLQAPKPSK
jgi:hypothetical protein